MKKLLTSLVAAALFLSGVVVGRSAQTAQPLPLNVVVQQAEEPLTDIDTSDYRQVWELIKSRHIKTDVKDSELFYGSVHGMVQALEDPYSVFLEPQIASVDLAHLEGSFGGIGIEIGQKDGRIVVIAPIADTPAAKAGVLAGDVITAIDGADTSKMTLLDVITSIRGEEGKPVSLTIYREGAPTTLDIKVVRERVVIETVKWKQVKSGKKTFMHVSISQFTGSREERFEGDTHSKFDKAVAEAKQAKVDGMIIDLRNNPGGMLDVALDITGHWDNESPLVIMEPRGAAPEAFGSEESVATLADMPTVVLVNKGSASASEIMAGALQDLGKARVIGETTFGKGCGQNVFRMPDGAELRLTTFLWKTPKGRSIDKTGITPDEILTADPADIAKGKDVQLKRAIQFLSTGR